MNNILFSGTCTAFITPFLNGRVHYHALDVLIDRQLDAGVTCFVLFGTTGESSTLDDDEKMEILDHCRKYIDKEAMIIAGSGSNCTRHAIRLSAMAMDHGADALLIVSPYYNKASNDGLISHYRQIANSVSIPVILYNVPSRTGLDIPVEVYRSLSTIQNIAGVKEASVDIRKIQRIRSVCPQNFGIWCGNDDMISASMAVGADGVISVASNIVPGSVKAITDAALNGNMEKAARLQRTLLPLIDCLFCEVNPIPVKYMLKQMRLDTGEYRLPLTAPSNANRMLIERQLANLESYDPSVFEYIT